MEIKEGIKESCEIEIKGKKFELMFPSQIRQQMTIETNKGMISEGQYAVLSFNNTVGGNRILDMVDMFSHFAVLIPNLGEVLGLKEGQKFMDMDFEEGKELLKQFQEVYAPFYNQFVTAEEMIGNPIIIAESIKKQKQLEESEENTED